jgi:DNA-binding Lrp family transcriptional regulator
MEVTKRQYEELLDEITKDIPMPIRDDEITSNMISEKVGCSKDAAREKLEKLFKDGKLKRRKALLNGCIGWAYSKNE